MSCCLCKNSEFCLIKEKVGINSEEKSNIMHEG